MSYNPVLTSNITEAMKIIFTDSVVEQYIMESEFADLIKRETSVPIIQTTGGRWVEMSHFFSSAGGVGARAENEYIPQTSQPDFKNSKIYLRKIMGTVEMSGDTMKRVTSAEGAFLDYMEKALPVMVQRISSATDRMYLGDGSGVRARINGALSNISGTIYRVPLDSAFGVGGLSGAWTLFSEGDLIVAAADAAGTTIRTGGGARSAEVIDLVDDDANPALIVNFPNGTLAGNWADNDYIAGGDEAGVDFIQASGEDREIAGLLAAVDDGGIINSYNGITRGAGENRLWKGLVVDASNSPWNGACNEELLVYVDDQIHRRGGGKSDMILFSQSANRSFWKSVKTDRMFVDPRSYTAGKPKGLEVMLGDRTLGFKVARKLPPELAYMLEMDSFARLSLHQWEWDDTNGSMWNRIVDATGPKDGFFAVGIMYEQMFCKLPRHNARIEGLAAVQ
jgi:hypothetical protein